MLTQNHRKPTVFGKKAITREIFGQSEKKNFENVFFFHAKLLHIDFKNGEKKDFF